MESEQPSDVMNDTFESALTVAFCLANNAHTGLKSGAYKTSGGFWAIFVSSALKSVSPLFTASSSVTVPPSASKLALKPSVSPWVYGLSSWIVTAVFAFSFWTAKSASTAAWMRSLCAVRK